jgi:hypothetical protein
VNNGDSRTLTNRESYHLTRITSREKTLRDLIASLNRELQRLSVEKNAILTVYGLPENSEFEFNEETNEVTIHGTAS